MRKYRLLHGAFVAEGPKLVGELLSRYAPVYVAATGEWLSENRHLLGNVGETDEVSHDELKRASLLRSPQSVLAVMPIPRQTLPDVRSAAFTGQLVLALDGVQDPGNLGTILRIADWFGIRHVLCSSAKASDADGTEGTADVYNPKCVQASMGALARVGVHYCNLVEVLAEAQMPLYGTFLMGGKNIYSEELTPNGIIVMGNEGKGISAEVSRLALRRLYVPSFPGGVPTTESLNVAVCTGIVCAEFRRRCVLPTPLRPLR